MNIRNKFRKKIEPRLEPGETLQQVFLAQTGPNPYWLFLTYLVFFRIRYWAFAVTDRRILVFRTGFWKPSDVKDLMATFPRETRFGPVSGLWSRIEMGGTRYWVHKRFQKDVEEADAALSTGAAPAS
jgi:hypothetical protein